MRVDEGGAGEQGASRASRVMLDRIGYRTHVGLKVVRTLSWILCQLLLQTPTEHTYDCMYMYVGVGGYVGVEGV